MNKLIRQFFQSTELFSITKLFEYGEGQTTARMSYTVYQGDLKKTQELTSKIQKKKKIEMRN